jgi:hypothetical protein
MCASLLSFVCSWLYKHPKQGKVARKLYGWFATWRYMTEYCIACFKNGFLGFYDMYRRMWSNMQWQTVKWSEAEVYQYKIQQHYAFESNVEEV